MDTNIFDDSFGLASLMRTRVKTLTLRDLCIAVSSMGLAKGF